MNTTIKSMLKISGIACMAFLMAQCSQENKADQTPADQFNLPDLMLKTPDFVGTKSVITGEGGVSFDMNDNLQVFVENTADEMTVWEDATHKYICADPAKGIFAPETPFVIEDKEASLNLYVMAPYNESVIDPIGGEESSTAFSFDGQIQDCNNPMAHLTEYDIMTGVVENVVKGRKPTVRMEHKSAMVHFNIENALRKPVNVQSVELIAPKAIMVGGSYSIDFTSGGLLTPIAASNIVALELQNAEQLGADGNFDVYFMTPSFALAEGDQLTVHVITDNGEWNKVFTMDADREFVAGSLNEAVAQRPLYTFEEVWKTTASDMGMKSFKIVGTAMNDKYVAVSQWGGDPKTDQFTLLNRADGKVAKFCNMPINFMSRVRSDESGNFLVCSETYDEQHSSHAFQFFRYDEETNGLALLFAYKGAHPQKLGYNMSVSGNFTKGDCYVYALGQAEFKGVDANRVYVWKFTDGKLTHDPEQPEVIDLNQKLPNKLFRASIQRESQAENSNYYFSYYVQWDKSFFGIATPQLQMTMMDSSNFLSRLLDFKVVTFEDKKLLITLEQGVNTFDILFVKVFDISDPEKMQTMIPGVEGYDRFLIAQSEPIKATNYNTWNSVDASVEKAADSHIVHICAGFLGENTLTAHASMYKLVYYNK